MIEPLVVKRSQTLRADNARILDDDLCLRDRCVDDLWLLDYHWWAMNNHRGLRCLCFTLNMLEQQSSNDTSQGTLLTIAPG